MNSIVIAFAVGVGAFQMQPELPPGWAGMLLGVSCLLLAAVRRLLSCRPVWRRASVWILCALLGFGWGWWRAELRLAEALPMSEEGRDVSVLGVIDGLPAKTASGVRFPFLVESGPSWLPGRVSLAWYFPRRAGLPVPNLQPGERWALLVRLKRPHDGVNPGGSDRTLRMLEEGTRASGYVREASTNRRIDAAAAGPSQMVTRLRGQIRARMLQGMHDRTWAGVLVALAVGDQQAISDEQWTRFRRLGIVHLVVISGLHVTLIGALAWSLAGGLWRRSRCSLYLPSQHFAAIVGALSASAYALLAGMGVSVQRSLIMLLVVAAAQLLGRKLAPTTVLGWAVMVVTMVDPWAVLSPGFWLSFGAVAVLLYISSGELGRLAGWRGLMRAQLAITLLMVPLLLILFQQFSLIAPLANALAIPVVSILITPLALLYAAIPFEPIGSLADRLLGWTMIPLDWLAALPFSVWQQASPPWPLVFAGLVGGVWLLLPRGTPGRAVGLLAFVPLLGWSPERPDRGEFRLVVLDVGQGLAVHLQTTRRDWLFDAGPAIPGGGNAGLRVVVPYLRATGVARLDTLVVSHPDLDHAGGAAAVLAAVPSRQRLVSPGDAHRMPEPERWGYCEAGRTELLDGVRFEWLHPLAAEGGEREPHGNNRSCVLKITGTYGSALLTADIESKVEGALVAKLGSRLRSDVLLVAHHGSRSSSSPEWVAAVQPRSVIYSVGYRSRFGHPHADVWARWSAAGARAYRTDSQGAISVDFVQGGPVIVAARERWPRYWHGR